MKNIDVTALGELLVDMAPGIISENGNMTFEACPGGAPCNVLAVLSSNKKKTAFLGKDNLVLNSEDLKKLLEKANLEASKVTKVKGSLLASKRIL